jgi:hypothetical protein
MERFLRQRYSIRHLSKIGYLLFLSTLFPTNPFLAIDLFLLPLLPRLS